MCAQLHGYIIRNNTYARWCPPPHATAVLGLVGHPRAFRTVLEGVFTGVSFFR